MTVPTAGSRDALAVTTDELFEPRIFARALTVPGVAGEGRVEVLGGRRLRWAFTPATPWEAGDRSLAVDPELEDLAGNNLLRPFEVDVTGAEPTPRAAALSFRIQP